MMTSNAQTVLVTGAAGFIGSHVCEALLARGAKIVGVDNFDPFYDANVKARNVAEVEKAAAEARGSFELVRADICDADAMNALFARSRPGGVIHLAAKAGVRPSIADPVGYSRANVLGTSVLLEAAKRAGVSRFVMASSSSVYGNNPRTPFAEDHDVSFPVSPYAATKRSCELIAHAHWHLTRMPTACLRFFTVFGPRQRPDLAIANFLRLVSRGDEVPMYGDGASSRDYTYVDDVVRGVLASYDRIGEHGYRIWNLGGSSPVPLAEMIATIGRTVGREPRVRPMPVQPGDVERTWADLTRSAAELDYRPRTPFEEGVRRQWDWLKAQP
jgi:UDP-glucuronate 4-epimerase